MFNEFEFPRLSQRVWALVGIVRFYTVPILAQVTSLGCMFVACREAWFSLLKPVGEKVEIALKIKQSCACIERVY